MFINKRDKGIWFLLAFALVMQWFSKAVVLKRVMAAVEVEISRYGDW